MWFISHVSWFALAERAVVGGYIHMSKWNISWGEAKMVNRPPVIACVVVLAAIFTLGGLRAASADVVNVDNFAVTRDGTTIFNDSFGAGLTFAGEAVRFCRRDRIFLMARRRTTMS
jgi:hypothetical protein